MSSNSSSSSVSPSSVASPVSKEKLTARDISRHFKKFDADMISFIFSSSELASALLSIFPRLSEAQMQWCISHMTCDQVRATIPKLQLQQTGVCVQVMSPEQIRTTLGCLPSDDRNLLMENISLLLSCQNREDLQAFVSFVDPLALCMAVQQKELASNLIESAAVMTKEQIRTIVPLLSCDQICTLAAVLEEDAMMEIVLSMIEDKRGQLLQAVLDQLRPLEQQHLSVGPKLEALVARVTELQQRIQMWQSKVTLISKDTYESLSRVVKAVKTDIETVQQSVRQLQRACILPRKLIPSTDAHLEDFQRLYSNTGDQAKRAYALFTEVDKLIAKLNDPSLQFEGTTTSSSRPETPDYAASPRLEESHSTEESVYSDDRATILYEAIKQIGNPDAIGTHYSMTWEEIIHGGFRTVEDFHAFGITSLEQLQKHLKEKQ